jgi:hypothetical protein
MKTENRLPLSYGERLHEILDTSWRILKSRFLDGRHVISQEAPFQHYFAHILTTIGDNYCTHRDDVFLVDLETKCQKFKGKTKYLDITCHFPRENVSCAIELKFKTAQQGAQDFGRIDAYVDIEALEYARKNSGFAFGKFYMITNSATYINKSKKGVGTVFCMHDKAQTIANGIFHCPHSKGREHVKVTLSESYIFEWEKIGDWYFLELTII